MALELMIDCGRYRAPCASCDDAIPRGHARLAEPCNDGRVPNAKHRYHHFECAFAHHPKLVRQALIAESFDEGLLPDPKGLLLELHERDEALEEGKPVPPRRVLVQHDPRVDELMPQLEDQPDDRGVLAVLADILTERGDPRGELIVLDLALEHLDPSEDDPRLERRNELRARLLPRICQHAQTTWGLGYIRRLVVGDWNGGIGSDGNYLSRLFLDFLRHPSLRLVRELAIGHGSEHWLKSPLPALRVLELADVRIRETLPVMPRLERITLWNTIVDAPCMAMLEAQCEGRKLARIELPGKLLPAKWIEPLRAMCTELAIH